MPKHETPICVATQRTCSSHVNVMLVVPPKDKDSLRGIHFDIGTTQDLWQNYYYELRLIIKSIQFSSKH